MENIIIILILVVIVGLSIAYIMKAKKRGIKCIGCPNGGNCAYKNEESSGCNCSGYIGKNK